MPVVMFLEKQFFQSDFLGGEPVDDLIDALLENCEAHGQGLLFGRNHHAVIDRAAVSVFILIDHAVAHGGNSGVNPEYYHISSLCALKRLDKFFKK